MQLSAAFSILLATLGHMAPVVYIHLHITDQKVSPPTRPPHRLSSNDVPALTTLQSDGRHSVHLSRAHPGGTHLAQVSVRKWM